MTYYVYMLKNIDRLKSKTYVGFTSDLKKRLNLHNNNKGAKSTKGYKWIVIFKKRFINKSKALSYEYTLKKNRKLRTKLLNEFK
jgi:putative endonuclease